MSKFHINADGNAKRCVASIRECKFGSDDHYSNKADAMKASELLSSVNHSDSFEFVKTLGDITPDLVEFDPNSKNRAVNYTDTFNYSGATPLEKIIADSKRIDAYNEHILRKSSNKTTLSSGIESEVILKNALANKATFIETGSTLNHALEHGMAETEDEEFYVYEVRVKRPKDIPERSGAHIKGYRTEKDDINAFSHEELTEILRNDGVDMKSNIISYHSEHYDPGSTSMAIKITELEIIGKRKVKRADAEEIINTTKIKEEQIQNNEHFKAQADKAYFSTSESSKIDIDKIKGDKSIYTDLLSKGYEPVRSGNFRNLKKTAKMDVPAYVRADQFTAGAERFTISREKRSDNEPTVNNKLNLSDSFKITRVIVGDKDDDDMTYLEATDLSGFIIKAEYPKDTVIMVNRVHISG